MSSSVFRPEWHARTLRSWQLAILRFAVTLDDADRLAVLAIANEIDNLASRHSSKPDFGFFRRNSAELCAAIMLPTKLTSTVLQEYLARIDNDRLKHVFAAAIGADQPKVSSVGESFRRDRGLWRGLSSRGNSRL